MPISRFAVVALGCSLLGPAACGGLATSEPVSSSPEASPVPAPSETSPEAQPELPPATRHGSVTFTSLRYNLLGSAYFADAPASPQTPGCRVEALTQPQTDEGRSAGKLTLTYTAATGGETRWPLSFAGGQYEADYGTADERIEAPGSTVRVEATGGVVPAFSGQVAVAEPLTVKGAVIDGVGATLEASSGRDLPLSWSTGSNDVVEVYLGDETKIVKCRFPAPATSGTLPSAMLVDVMPAAAGGEGCPAKQKCINGGVRGVRSSTVRAGEYAVELRGVYWQPLQVQFTP